jgi:hypothetical protein
MTLYTSKPATATNKNLLGLQRQRCPFYAFKVFRVKSNPDIGYPPVRLSSAARYRLKEGTEVNQKTCDSSPLNECGIGLHVATIEWATRYWDSKWARRGVVIWRVLIEPLYIGAVPFRSLPDNSITAVGKFRVRKFTMVCQVDWRGHKRTKKAKP